MTKDDIIRIAQEAGWSGIYSQWVNPTEREHLTVPVTMEQIERFATLVAAAEREKCAILAFNAKTYIEAAQAIRARGNK